MAGWRFPVFVHVDELGCVYRLLNGSLQLAPLHFDGKFDLHDEEQWVEVEEVLFEHAKTVHAVMEQLGGSLDMLPAVAPLSLEQLRTALLDSPQVYLRFAGPTSNYAHCFRAVKLQEDGFGCVGSRGERLFVNLPPALGYTYDQATQTTFINGLPAVTISLYERLDC